MEPAGAAFMSFAFAYFFLHFSCTHSPKAQKAKIIHAKSASATQPSGHRIIAFSHLRHITSATVSSPSSKAYLQRHSAMHRGDTARHGVVV